MIRTTRTKLDKRAKEVILKGVNAIYQPVKRSLGPDGNSALIYGTYGKEPRITDDGYTIAEAQEPKDPFVNLVSQIFRDACERTDKIVGDGTTTTVVIGGKLYNEIHGKLIGNQAVIGEQSGRVNEIALKKEILEASVKVKEAVKKVSKKVKSLKDLEKIAKVSVKNEELGKIVAKMAWEVGVDGFIDVVEGYKGEIETEVIKGMKFPAKIAAKGFINNQDRFEMVIEDSAVLVTNYKLTNKQEVMDTMDKLVQKYPKIVILAPEFSQDVLELLYNSTFKVQNQGGQIIKQKGKYELYPVKVPSLRTEQFDDLAIYCGAQFINKDTGKIIVSINDEDLGFIDKLIVKDIENKEDAVIIGGRGTKLKPLEQIEELGFEDEPEKRKKTPIQERLDTLQGQLKETRQEQFKNLLRRRIAGMSSAVGVIRVGGVSRAEIYYKKKKLEDAVYACKSALRGGYVKGGGICLKDIVEELDVKILKNALLEPYNQIQSGAEKEISDDIIDPAEVIYYSVEHACSVVAELVTLNIITPEIELSLPEEGNFAIARQMAEEIKRKKKKDGLWNENEQEAWDDNFGGMTETEYNETFEHE